MTKKPAPTKATEPKHGRFSGDDAPRRRPIEAHRDDCRRHDQCAVRIAFIECGSTPRQNPRRFFNHYRNVLFSCRGFGMEG